MKLDVIDTIASLPSGSPLQLARLTRPQFTDGAESCRAAVIAPAVDVGLGLPLRAALAARMARLNADQNLERHYRETLQALAPDPGMIRVAEGGYPANADMRLRAIIRHTDLLTIAPRACTRADTERLHADGLSVPEVVALTELIGFLNFEVRIVATLNLLKEPA